MKTLRYDIEASIVVFLVALPLCLGIALASGASPISGILAGIVGGIVVGAISGSQLSVSGPAAGLTVIVAAAIQDLGSFEIFLSAVVLAGLIQILLSYAKAGAIGYLFPNAVIKGMLSAIGIILIIKQIPHAFGADTDYLGDLDFFQSDGHTTFSGLKIAINQISPGAMVVFATTLFSLLATQHPKIANTRFFKAVPSSLISIIIGSLVSTFLLSNTTWALTADDLVNVPTANSMGAWISNLHFPDFSQVGSHNVWMAAITIALIASLESLLSVCAIDKLDPQHRVTPPNRELLAQGVGNLCAGLIGGLPVTAVIVRSSANIEAGGKTKTSAIIHGAWLLVCVMFIPNVLNSIPVASLAALLVLVGYKLATPALFQKMWREGLSQFLPFIATVVAILFTDLLMGVAFGLVIGLGFVLRANLKSAFFVANEGNTYIIKLQQKVTFVNKLRLMRTLEKLPKGATVVIDGTKSFFIDHDVIDAIGEFCTVGKHKGIEVIVKRSAHALVPYFRRSSAT
ncbi:MAG: hypothetical protein COV45_00210 [Deltaproteobacteria bacterium CG11_big_fil_rev_8_21_14_0_20_47_16]|nr:MAG: hypothetical protein COV45_00210 [Deltaproteobacteria bacterium CG11_big_fil_rev_8_21_14_0_20_47_16]